MMKRTAITLSLALFSSSYLCGNEPSLMEETLTFVAEEVQEISTPQTQALFPFTGKVNGNKVRLRIRAELDSPVVQELTKDDLFTVVGEQEGFWAVEAPKNANLYIFRSFVLDNIVEGSRVNVRLYPDLEAPIIAHLNTGDRIDGRVCAANSKWLEMSPPAGTQFFIAKDFIEKIGPADIKAQMDDLLAKSAEKLSSITLLANAELSKDPSAIDTDQVVKAYEAFMEENREFPSKVTAAKEALARFQQASLQKKKPTPEPKAEEKVAIAFEKTSSRKKTAPKTSEASPGITDKMLLWQPVEESLYLSWASVNDRATKDEFYVDQKLSAVPLSGIVDVFNSPVKNKPGDYVIKVGDVPIAYIYSTEVNLQELIGQKVHLKGIPRANHHFAFPAYFVYTPEE